jgi:hypothetical protein
MILDPKFVQTSSLQDVLTQALDRYYPELLQAKKLRSLLWRKSLPWNGSDALSFFHFLD